MTIPATFDGANLLLEVALPAAGYKAANQRKIISEFGAALPLIVRAAGLSTGLRLAHFLAQATHENDAFCTLEEYASGSAYEGRKDLGNVRTGDGRRFKGRGGFHLTGRANYTAFTAWMRAAQPDCPDFTENPEAVADLPWAAWSAIWYWQTRKLNAFADDDDLLTITRRINGGTTGIDRRRVYLTRAKAAVAALEAALVPSDPAGRPVLLIGSAGDSVEALQRMLRACPIGATLTVDGHFGAVTRHWVLTFQRAFGLQTDGIVGARTWDKLTPFLSATVED